MTDQEIINAVLDAARHGQWLMAFAIGLSLVVEVFDRLDVYKAKLEASPFGWAANLIPHWAMLSNLSEGWKKLVVVGLSGLGALLFGIAGHAPYGDIMRMTATSALYAAGFHSLAISYFPKGPTPPQLQPAKD